MRSSTSFSAWKWRNGACRWANERQMAAEWPIVSCVRGQLEPGPNPVPDPGPSRPAPDVDVIVSTTGAAAGSTTLMTIDKDDVDARPTTGTDSATLWRPRANPPYDVTTPRPGTDFTCFQISFLLNVECLPSTLVVQVWLRAWTIMS